MTVCEPIRPAYADILYKWVPNSVRIRRRGSLKVRAWAGNLMIEAAATPQPPGHAAFEQGQIDGEHV